MKKRIRCLLLVLMFCLVLCVGAAAAEQTGAQLSYVTDAAGLLSENENMLLEKMAESVSKKYGVGVYIVTVEDYRDFHSEGVYKATYTIYHECTMGEGPNRDGIMLLLSMTDRKWAMFCYGSRCEYAFNSYGQEKLEKVFLDNFGENDWYGGFEDYVKECSVYLEKASVGKPVRASLFIPILIVIGLSLLAAAAVVAGNLGLGACGLVVSGNVAIALAVAVTAADGITLAGVMDLDVVQAAAARLVMAAIILRAIQIRHTKHLRP